MHAGALSVAARGQRGRTQASTYRVGPRAARQPGLIEVRAWSSHGRRTGCEGARGTFCREMSPLSIRVVVMKANTSHRVCWRPVLTICKLCLKNIVSKEILFTVAFKTTK